MLEVTDLTHAYGRGSGAHLAVDGIGLKAGKGELVSIVGPSGCGKSTVLRCIAGLLRPARGRITVNGPWCTARRRTGWPWCSRTTPGPCIRG